MNQTNSTQPVPEVQMSESVFSEIARPQLGESEIMLAAQSNSLEQLSNILRTGNQQLNFEHIRNPRNFTILHFACFNSNLEMVKLIIQHFVTAKKPHEREEALANFINLPTSDGYTAIHFASYRGSVPILNFLCERGGNPLVVNNQGMNIMHIAAQGDQPISIVFAMKKGLTLDSYDNNEGSALHWGCYYGQERAVTYLLAHIEKDPPYHPLNKLDKNGLAPIHLAVLQANTKLVKKLMQWGAQKDLKNGKGQTPANIALEQDYKNIHKLLTRERNCLVAYYNIKQPVKRMRRSPVELLRFLFFIAFLFGYHYIYIAEMKWDNCSWLGLGVFATTLLMFLLIAFWNPGYQKKSKMDLLQLLEQNDPSNVCPYCNVRKVARTRHCEICQRCVLVYDHHCPWINNCVGAGNHVAFLFFIFLLELALIYFLIVSIYSFTEEKSPPQEVLKEEWCRILMFILCCTICGVFFLGISLLIYTQFANILLGVTTFERFAANNNNLSTLNRGSQTQPSLLGSINDSQAPPRFRQARFKNCLSFLKNHTTYRKKEQDLLNSE